MRHVAANRILAGADINDVGIRLAHADRADRAAEILVGDRCPGDSAVGRLEDSAPRRSEVVLIGTLARSGYRDRSSSPKRADLAPAQGGEGTGVVRGR